MTPLNLAACFPQIFPSPLYLPSLSLSPVFARFSRVSVAVLVVHAFPLMRTPTGVVASPSPAFRQPLIEPCSCVCCFEGERLRAHVALLCIRHPLYLSSLSLVEPCSCVCCSKHTLQTIVPCAPYACISAVHSLPFVQRSCVYTRSIVLPLSSLHGKYPACYPLT